MLGLIENTVNIMDLFCGPGQDSEGTLGSPLVALKVLKPPNPVIAKFALLGREEGFL